MDIDITGKVIVVTGAARGIGRALALGLAAEGARVAVLARERKQAQLVVDEIGEMADAPGRRWPWRPTSATRPRWPGPPRRSTRPGAGSTR